jgi:NADPH-dependent 2,4-dienoyl-CoA reductase/sulfur reductase-like enzyme/peroxiredoxin family protein/TusA-related sulfurtransferase/rhodanese-related sulfurtransferase
MSKKILIVGGVAGGASAAARLRRLDEHAEIIMFERGNHISFANCGLPYHISEVIKEREKLLVQTPEGFNGKLNVDVRIKSEIIKIDSKNNKVMVNSKDRGTYEESYDYLILSPGASPIKPPIPGINNDKIFTLRNVDDTDSIKNYVDNNNIKSAAVIGGGFIGIEMAENLKEKGVDVTLVEAAPHILAPFDSDMVTIAEKEMQDNGVKIILNNAVKSFNYINNRVEVSLNDDTRVTVDMVILAIGVSPDTRFLQCSGIELGPRKHIKVNENLQTSIENIYAVGDAVEVKDLINGNQTAIPLAGPANKQGRIAADNIAGITSTYKGSQGTSILKVFDLTCASTGNNERTLQKLGIGYKVIYIHPQSHASYYPGATPLALKLIFNDEGKILGAQGIGYDGVDKRIDVIASVIRLNGSIYDLEELELAYAPPYSSAKDPVNMAGFVAENVLTGKTDVILPRDIEDAFHSDKHIILDVRTTLERENGFIKNSQHIVLDELRNNLNKLDKDKEIWVYCQVGLRGYLAERILKQNGFKVKNITGGYKTFTSGKFKPSKVENNTGDGEDKNNTEKKVAATLSKEEIKDNHHKSLNACGLCCPGPLMRTKNSVDEMQEGEILKITASDPGFYEDIKAWCKRTNNELLDISKEKGIITAYLKKSPVNNSPAVSTSNSNLAPIKDNKTMVVFSGDLDKAIASFIIANGAASMGKKVTMFFTFWGINVLRKHERVSVTKNFIENMFGKMMPRGSKRLKLSNMNMAGMGPKMIRGIMKKHNVSSLEELMQAAINNGVEIVACQMSMDLLGLKKEELIDGVKIGGVGYYLGEAEDSNVNLFI